MKPNDIQQAFDEISPNAAQKHQMLEQILLARKENHMKKHIKILAPIAACLVLAVAVAAVVPHFTQAQPQPPVACPTTAAPANLPNGQQEIQVELPTMLGGQEVTWGSNVDEVQKNLFDVMHYRLGWTAENNPEAFDQMVGNMRVTGVLADGTVVTLGLALEWQGEADDWLAALAQLENSSYTIAPLEVNATVSRVSTQSAQDNSAAIFRLYVSEINEGEIMDINGDTFVRVRVPARNEDGSLG